MEMINGRNAVQRRIRGPHDAVNNNDILYFAVNSINYITLNMFPEDCLDSYNNFLRSIGFNFTEGKPTHDKNHKRVRIYTNPQITAYDGKPFRVYLFLYPINKYRNYGITTKIYYPTKELLDWFVAYFSMTYMPNISFLELTFDCFTEQIKELHDLFELFLLMRFNRLEPNKIGTTSYQTDEVKSKGMRLYVKEDMAEISVRVELMFKRQIIKNLGFGLETLDQDLQGIDFSKYFGFKRFLEDVYRKRQDYRLEKMFKEDRRKKNRTERKSWKLEDSHALQERIKDNAVDNLLTDVEGNGPRPIAQINSLLRKGEKRRQDFYEELQEMNEVFFSGINNRSFLE